MQSGTVYSAGSTGQSLQCRAYSAESTMQINTVDSNALQRLQPGVTELTVQIGRGYRAESQSTDCRMAESSYSTELTELQRL